GRDNSMYLYGLCFRNGYGLSRNEDSAKYWLQKAADMGYAQAKQELLLKVGENANDSAGALVQKINNAALPPETVLNEFRKITPHIASRELITGNYSGYLLQYDWSGRHIISNKAVTLSLERPDSTASAEASINELTGEWVEKTTGQDANSQIATARLNATLKDDSLLFKDTHYAVRDHYSQGHTITYNFESASLNLVCSGDSVYLAGSIELFSPDRKEPSKPLFVALVRSLTSDGGQTDTPLDKWAKDKQKDSTDKGGASLQLVDVKVYPNPFASSVTVEFTVKGPTEVAIQLISMSGTVVYKKPKQTLQPGRYAITLSPGRIASGAYFVRLVSGAQAVDVKVIRK
ncbi:MAG TPA: T9SS type A sorting domain-containing protein, partial [Arachidicoccus sp.]|nr:T9SS type A sorting domain-containing protein [Arachidicoccus sp.]